MSLTVNKMCHTSCLKVSDLLFGGSYGTLRSPLVIFFGVVGFVSSVSFQQYQWCHHKKFGVSLGSLYFFLFTLSSLSFIFIESGVQPFCDLKELHMTLAWLVNLRCHLWISKLYYFSKYFLDCVILSFFFLLF